MADAPMLRHLKVLSDSVDVGAVRSLKFFAIGNAAEVEGKGEVLPLLSFVDDNLSRYVISNVPSTSWGRPPPSGVAPFIFALPNRAVRNKDAVFLLSQSGQDYDEPHPSGQTTMHFVHLAVPAASGASSAPGRLWATLGARVYLYKLEAVQTKAVLPPPHTVPKTL